MAHEITQRADGTAEAAFAFKVPWHGLGTIVTHVMNSEEALRLARLDWTVRQEPVYLREPDGAFTKLSSGHLVNVRDDNDHPLGVVTPKYKVIQNTESFSFLDRLHSDGIMRYESAFSLSGGRKVVILARLPKSDMVVPGDQVDRFLLLSNSHDGTEGVRIGLTTVRVVCQNTYRMALSLGGIATLSVRHDQGLDDHLDKAMEIVGKANDKFDTQFQINQSLARRRLTTQEWDEFLDIVCPIPSEHDPEWTSSRVDAIRDTRNTIEGLYFSAETCSLNGTISRTAWSAFNAFTQHVDHMPRRGRTERARSEARFRVVTDGTGYALKQRAFDTVCSIAGVK